MAMDSTPEIKSNQKQDAVGKVDFLKGKVPKTALPFLGGKAEYESKIITHIFWGCSHPPPEPQPPLLKPNQHPALHYNIEGGGHSNILESTFNFLYSMYVPLLGTYQLSSQALPPFFIRL